MTHIEKLHLDAAGGNDEYEQDMLLAFKSAQITEDIAIEFGEWLADTATWRNGSRGALWYSMREKRPDMSSKQLFQEFLKTKQNI